MEENVDKETVSGLRILRTTFPDSNRASSHSHKSDEDQLLNILQKESLEISMVLTMEGQIKYANAAVYSLLGYQSTKLLGNNIQRIIPVHQWVAFRAALRASEEESGESIAIDCQFINVEDRRFSFSVRVKDYREHPQVEGFVVQAQLIERLKEKEEKLKLRNLTIELIKEAVVIIDPNRQKILFANKAFYELSGFTPQEIMGGKFNLFKSPYAEMLFDEQTDPKQKEKFFKALKNRIKFSGRIFSKKKNGSVFYNRFNLSPVINAEDKLTHYIASMKAINRRKK